MRVKNFARGTGGPSNINLTAYNSGSLYGGAHVTSIEQGTIWVAAAARVQSSAFSAANQ